MLHDLVAGGDFRAVTREWLRRRQVLMPTVSARRVGGRAAL